MLFSSLKQSIIFVILYSQHLIFGKFLSLLIFNSKTCHVFSKNESNGELYADSVRTGCQGRCRKSPILEFG
jgi:hypothetical protein